MSRILNRLGKLRTEEVRVAVVGLGAAGKTVFLTSLINHLRDHDPDLFRLGSGSVEIRRFKELPPEPGWEQFNYAGHRARFVERDWPRKTRDRSQFICTFERSDWYSEVRLVLHDLPGERIADAAMLGRDFATWSDHYLAVFNNEKGYRECTEEYLTAVHSPDIVVHDLLDLYRRCLARLITAYRPYVSPSVYLLDQAGKVNRVPGQAGEPFRAGLDDRQEFCPLPAEVRARRPQLAASFEDHYARYVAQVVRPVFEALAGCHGLVVLVDVTMLLAGGTGMYNDNRQVVLDLLEALSPGSDLLRALWRGAAGTVLPYWLRPGGITRVAIVAPKLDQVHPDDRDRMSGLVKQMFGRAVGDHIGLRSLFLNCSAVVSTEVMPGQDGQRWLRGLLLYDQHGGLQQAGAMQKFEVSELPAEWPLDWSSDHYRFPEVYPQMPPRRDAPPRQIHLDRILDFLLT